MMDEDKTIDSRKEILHLKEVTKSFYRMTAVSRVSMSLMRGETRALIGPNGAGKTTLFNLIAGSLMLDAGQIFFQGHEITKLPPHKICRRGLSRTFQIASIFPKMTVLESVQTAVLCQEGKMFNFILRAKKLALDKTVELLETVGLLPQKNKISNTLSLGDQRLLELAIVLAGAPTLLLLDEPTAGMASHERFELISLIGRIAEEKNLTLLFIEHDMDVVFSIARKITVMHEGRIIAEGEPSAIRSNEEVQGVYLGWQNRS